MAPATTRHGFLRVAAACPRVAVGDPEANATEILATVAEARAQGAQVVVLPELCLTGYTCGDLFFSLHTLVGGAERALGRLLEQTAREPAVLVVGLPLAAESKLFNVAAVCQSGRLLGLVPKSYLPGYREYYEERWFSTAREVRWPHARLLGQDVPFGTDLVFAPADEPGLCLAVEICEDLWMPVPPSSLHAVAGATVLLCPSASNELVLKAEYRRELVRVHSARTLAGYVYANCGVHESTSDLVFGGQLLVAENGTLLAEGERFRRDNQVVVTDLDVERLLVERSRQTSFTDAVHAQDMARRRIALLPIPAPARLVRPIDPHPFVPGDPARLDERCQEVFSIQTAGLAKRLEHTGVSRVTLGLSGGLDSTLALLVCIRAFDLLGLPRSGILTVSLPGFGTTEGTRRNARRLAEALHVGFREIDIRAACTQHLQDIGLDPSDRSSIAYQNAQARERTQVLFDLANKEDALHVGTGDLSEIALGWSTYGGDQLSNYAVNSGVPKTLVKELIRWVAEHQVTGPERETLRDVLQTPVSPELVPPGADGAIAQRTEDILGPYELHDFFLHCFVRLGAGPARTLFMAEHAFAGRYDRERLRAVLRTFLTRFFAQQFKRQALPDGPKVGSVSLSPRGDWRMPSDASADAWIKELD